MLQKPGLHITEPFSQVLHSESEEDAIVCGYIIQARQGTPLSISEFIELACVFAEKEEDGRFSRHFTCSFVRRHSSQFCMKTGTITSPTRRLETLQKATEDFIEKQPVCS